MGEFDDIIPEFIAESRELLETVESGLLALESGEVEEEVIHTVFRAIHSIKGGAGFVGLTKIEHLAHKMEDLLNLIRNHELEPTPAVTDALLQSLDVLVELFDRVEEQDAIDIEGPMRALEAALHAGVSEEIKQDLQPAEPQPQAQAEGLPRFSVSQYTLKSKLAVGNVFYLHLNLPQIESRGLTPMQLVNEMLSMGEILDSRVNLPQETDLEKNGYQVTFDVLYYTVLEQDLLLAALRLDEDDVRQLSEEDFVLASAEGEPPPGEEAPAAESGAGAETPAPAPQETAPQETPAQEAPAPRPAPPAAAPPPAAPAPPASAPPPAVEPEAVSPPRRGGEYLTFHLGGEIYGVDILQVQEIIGMPRLTRLPRSPQHVLGVMNLRGMVVPVLDLRLKLGLEEAEAEPVVIVVVVQDKHMGMVVDAVEDVVDLKEEEVQETPDFSDRDRRDYLRGLARHDEQMIILLELDRLLAQELQGHGS